MVRHSINRELLIQIQAKQSFTIKPAPKLQLTNCSDGLPITSNVSYRQENVTNSSIKKCPSKGALTYKIVTKNLPTILLPLIASHENNYCTILRCIFHTRTLPFMQKKEPPQMRWLPRIQTNSNTQKLLFSNNDTLRAYAVFILYSNSIKAISQCRKIDFI